MCSRTAGSSIPRLWLAPPPAPSLVRSAAWKAISRPRANTDVARTERLLSTAVLGFAASEAAGRFLRHDQAVIDADFAELQQWLRRLLPSSAV